MDIQPTQLSHKMLRNKKHREILWVAKKHLSHLRYVKNIVISSCMYCSKLLYFTTWACNGLRYCYVATYHIPSARNLRWVDRMWLHKCCTLSIVVSIHPRNKIVCFKIWKCLFNAFMIHVIFVTTHTNVQARKLEIFRDFKHSSKVMDIFWCFSCYS
jgi:hypothetical protein